MLAAKSQDVSVGGVVVRVIPLFLIGNVLLNVHDEFPHRVLSGDIKRFLRNLNVG